jgi:hypothetical protein
LHQAIERNESLIWRRLKKDYPKIKEQAKQEKAGIYFGDAPRIRSDHHAGRTWGAKGVTPIVRASSARHGMSLISAHYSRGHVRFTESKHIDELQGPVAPLLREKLKRLNA